MLANDRQLYWRLLKYVKIHWQAIVLSLIGTAIYGISELLVPIIIRPLIDEGFFKQDLKAVYIIVFFLIIGYLIRGISNFFSSYFSAVVAQNVVYNLRLEMFAQQLKLPMNYFDKNNSGNIVSRFSYDVVQLMDASTNSLLILVREIVTIIALSCYLFYLDWKLTLLIFSVAPFISIIIWYVSYHLRKLANALQENMGEINNIVNEAVAAREVIRIYQGEKYENKRFQQQANNIKKDALKSQLISALTSPLLEMIIVLALAAVIVLSAIKSQSSPDNMTAGTFISFLSTMGLLFPPIKRLGKVTEPIQRGLAAAHSIFQLLDETTEKIISNDKNIILKGKIQLRNLSFSYAEKLILDDLSITIKAGESIALIGESGSGKSTLAALLAGFYRPTAGQILIDDADITAIDYDCYRRALAYVAQKNMLFAASVAENIAYPPENIDKEKMHAAAAAAYADAFIANLSHNYDCFIGEQGNLLSGGQQQRLSIARALYKDAPILILDEATSALDIDSENKIQRTLQNLRGKKTVLIIAHRLATVRHADKIIVLQGGKIIESGDHNQLIAKNGVYAKLLRRFSD